MNYKFEQEFRKDNPQTIGETDKHFDLDNYKDWLESKLSEALKPHQSKSAEEIAREFVQTEYKDYTKLSELDKICFDAEVTHYVEFLNFATLQTAAKEKEFCEALEVRKAIVDSKIVKHDSYLDDFNEGIRSALVNESYFLNKLIQKYKG